MWRQVCGYWRQIVNETPSLWTRVPLTRPCHIKTTMERSRGFPLTVIDWIDDGNRRKRGRLADFIWLYGIPGLHIGASEEDLKSAHEALRGMLPALTTRQETSARRDATRASAQPSWQSLSLTNTGTSAENANSLLIPISQTFLNRLLEFEATGFALQSYQNFLVPSLTSLSLTGPNTAADASQMLAVLGTLTKLQRLELLDAIRPNQSHRLNYLAVHAGKKKAELHHLRYLRVRGSFMSCSPLIATLSLPVDATLHLDFHDHGHDYAFWALPPFHFKPVAEQIRMMSKGSRLRKLSISSSRDSTRGHTKCLTFSVWAHRARPGLDELTPLIQLSVWDDEPCSHEVIKMICDALASDDIEYMQVDADMTLQDWTQRFGRRQGERSAIPSSSASYAGGGRGSI
ncbi:hypothetical protein NEOLEDRAFT_721213 [Neolentinus lepideus HHB14362 ss-1]|uniref:F-box domain-containing protein n=1 Tax=Neolentinus lepideus HHB14362 ss-1 TaxID=1314782 RepID=A0A165Q234_9AGAM|nr:hypothetical protein NEOLEDRAFT_721213 [Neolentinus lepideus HHB14362 ss-1]